MFSGSIVTSQFPDLLNFKRYRYEKPAIQSKKLSLLQPFQPFQLLQPSSYLNFHTLSSFLQQENSRLWKDTHLGDV
jgi:hypothetical protein